MQDIELYNAMLVYEPGGAAKVLRHPCRFGEDDGFTMSVGACFSDWRTFDDRGRLLKLMIEAWHAVASYGVDAVTMHHALNVIPEYRAILAPDWAQP